MGRKTVLAIMLVALLLMAMLTLAFTIQLAEASGTIYIRADCSVDPPTAPIQRNGDIYTFTGNIYEPVVIERDNIVVDGAHYTINGMGGGAGINLAGRSNVTVKNTIIMAFQYGVWLFRSTGNRLLDNNITQNLDSGIIVDFGPGPSQGSFHNEILNNNMIQNGGGVYFDWPSHNNNISNNRITANTWHGITLAASENNILYGNNITRNGYYGIKLSGSSSNTTLRNNIMAENRYNLEVYAWGLGFYLNDIDVSNTIDSKPVYYWINKRDMTVPLDAGYVALINCTNITAKNLNLTNNGEGLLLVRTQNSTITQNNIAGSYVGVWLTDSSNNNILSKNNVANNEIGIWLQGSNNIIYHNNFLNNRYSVDIYLLSGSNAWDAGYPTGGNYWSDYKGTDQYKGPYQNETGSDGIGDTPYIIDENNRDRYPLMKPFTPLLGDLNDDLRVDILDLAIAALAFGSYPGDPRWNPKADINQDNKVNIIDLAIIAKNFGKSWR